MSNQVELHDYSASCPLAHPTPESGVGDIGRRAFLTQGALAAIALALAACTSDSPVDPSVDSPNTIRLADHPTLASVGGIAFVTLGEVSLAVVRTGNASFVALSRACPHQGAIVEAKGTGFTYPRHGAQFSTTGKWVGGRQTTNLVSYPVRYEASKGTLTIEI
jgi:nitrite reductase/ring-hydroxylating ferredoxin subunit